MNIDGVILCGGQSRRMGRAKAELDFRGKTFLENIIESFAVQVNDLYIAGSVDSLTIDGGVFNVLKDRRGVGPLAGVHSGLSVCKAEWLVVLPCDNPIIPDTFVADLVDCQQQTQAPLVYVCVEQAAPPLYALISKQLLPDLERYLRSSQAKVMDWYRMMDAGSVSMPAYRGAFTNINFPQEYEQFLRLYDT